MKELQGLSLKVDLVHSDTVVDAEAVLASNIQEEAKNPAEVEAPKGAISEVDVTEDGAVDEFAIVDVDESGSPDAAANAADNAVTVTADGDDAAAGADEGKEA